MDQHTPAGDITTTLGLESGKRPWAGRRRWWWLAAVPMLAWGVFRLWPGEDEPDPRYRTEQARRGDLTVTVSATGTLEPTNEVEVGSEMSGTLDEVYVDVNETVRKGQLLARLNVTKQRDTVAKARATLAAAEAAVLQKQATVAVTRATLGRYQQVAELSGGKVPSQLEMDTAEADLRRALADEASARAEVLQAKASLSVEETTLSKAYIHAPIDGVVLSRKVDPGQTVAAAMETPVLFKLAEDLTKMELQVAVDEADVGNVMNRQAATFTVDAWPNRKYAAHITRVSYGAQSTGEVVSYLTTLQVENQDLSLRPGMTATAEITTVQLKNVLLIPNAALRFSPPEASAPTAQSRGLLSAMLPRPPMQGPKKTVTDKREGSQRIWILRNGQAEPMDVAIGHSDGKHTQVTGGALQADMHIITDTWSTPQP